MVDDGAHGGELDRVCGHEDDDEAQIPLHDSGDHAGHIGADLRALKNGGDACAIGRGVDPDGAQALRQRSGESASDDPAKDQDQQRTEDRWDCRYERRESGG